MDLEVLKELLSTSLVAQAVKNLPAMWETWVRSQGGEDLHAWRRAWQPTPVFVPGKFHGQRSPVSYSPWGCKESEMTEQLTLSLSRSYYSKALDKC